MWFERKSMDPDGKVEKSVRSNGRWRVVRQREPLAKKPSDENEAKDQFSER